MQNSCNTLYPVNMVCFRYISVNTLHKGDNRDDDNDEDNNNNNIFIGQSVLKMLCSVHHFRISFELIGHSK